VTPASSDAQQLVPAIDAIERTLGDKPKQILADAGYWSEPNVEESERASDRPLHRDWADQAQRTTSAGVE
jgi:hypothetical protein